MKAYSFAFPQRGPDLHKALFNQLKEKNNHDFDQKNENRAKLIFHGIENRIMARSAIKPQGLISKEEILNVEQGSKIKGYVTLSRMKQSYLSKSEIDSFTQEKGREPSKKELYPYINLEGDRLEEYLSNLFIKAGLQMDHFIDLDNGQIHFSKTKTTFKAMDIVFEATITDLSEFEHAWFNGIGRYKTMGFGMLRVVKK